MIQDERPPHYWRNNKSWSKYLGKTGKVIAATYIHISTPELGIFTPYSYVIVDFGTEKREFMGAGHEKLATGDQVECVLRKSRASSAEGVISYGIKVRKIIFTEK